MLNQENPNNRPSLASTVTGTGGTMDIPRRHAARRRRIRRALQVSIGITTLVLITAGLSRLKPADPVVEGSSLWPGTVERGLMLRQVRGAGRLVPEEITWISAGTEGRVERIPVLPGIALR